MSAIPQLPNEVIEEILTCLPPLPHSKQSVHTLCELGLANSRFLAISRLSHIWKPHYIARYIRSAAAHEELHKSKPRGKNWWQQYVLRSRADCRALDLLEGIIEKPDERNSLAVELVRDLGYGVWEAVDEQTFSQGWRQCNGIDADVVFEYPSEGLTRCYWAQEILGIISRTRAIEIWRPLINPLDDQREPVSFEKGLAALSAFFGEDLDRISEELDKLAIACQTHLSNQKLTEDSDLTEIIVQICAWMRQHGFVKTDLTNYHNLLNHFPHRVLFKEPATLPISLVYVFVCVTRRLGYDARPVAFPHKVLAMVLSPLGQPIYVDVFESATRPILSYTSDLPLLLQSMGIPPDSLAEYAAPADTTTMVLRAVGNIIHSLQRIVTWSESDQMAAHYAAYCAALLLTGDRRLVQPLFVAGVGGPLDSEAVLKTSLYPCLQDDVKSELVRFLVKEAEISKNKPKNEGRKDVKYFTGMIFRHRKYSYIGVIKGWDYRCEAGDEWIRRMRVDDLSQGRHQPFYHSFTPDGHVRYVAEENIEPVARTSCADLLLIININKELGRWFDGIDIHDTGTTLFILSSETLKLYPDDEAAADKFILEHEGAGYVRCLRECGPL